MLRQLKNNTDITIVKVDKENAIVVMNTSDYKNKLSIILQDPIH